MNRYMRVGAFSRVEHYFNLMIKDKVQPNHVVYGTMFRCLAKNQKFTDAISLYEKSKNGVQN